MTQIFTFLIHFHKMGQGYSFNEYTPMVLTFYGAKTVLYNDLELKSLN